MKKKFFLIVGFLFTTVLFSQEIQSSDLIGEWKFIELQDEKGEKQTTIPFTRFGNGLVEKVNRDSYIFMEDGEYKSFNPLNESSGHWRFNGENKIILLEMRIPSDGKYIEDLKAKKIVELREDGFYYQNPVGKRILFFSQDSLTIQDRDNYYLIYKKQ